MSMALGELRECLPRSGLVGAGCSFGCGQLWDLGQGSVTFLTPRFLLYILLREVISRAFSSCHIPHIYDSVIKFLKSLSTDKSAIMFCILSTGSRLLPEIPGPSRYGVGFGGRVSGQERLLVCQLSVFCRRWKTVWQARILSVLRVL